MSILSSLYHHAIRNKPNDVHNEPESPDPRESKETQDARALHDALEQTAALPRTQAAPSAPACSDGSAVLTASAEKRREAHAEGHMRPALYYTAQEQQPCASGVWESPHTVASRLESKEEYPQG